MTGFGSTRSRRRALAVALSSLAICLPCSADGGGMLARTLLGRLLVVPTKLHLAINALALEFLFQRSKRLVDVVVPNNDLHILGFCYVEQGSLLL